jgi:hypothetical protein
VAIVAHGSLGAALFLLIGLLTVAYGGRQILAAVGPRPQLWADRLKAEAGETINLRWATSSRFNEASFIRITWEGRETAITRAYNPIFHESSFVTRVITSVNGPLAGSSSIVVPQPAMPSFAAKNASVEWRLRAEVETPRWPNVKEQYTMVILPSRVEPR